MYASRTMRSNCIGLPFSMKNVKKFKKKANGKLDWMTHDSRKMCSILWKDEQLILLFFTHALRITQEDPMNCIVSRKDGANCPVISTSSVLFEYTKNMQKNMQSVDVADQLRRNHC